MLHKWKLLTSAVFLLVSVCASHAQSQPLAANCQPRLGAVTPEFVIFESKDAAVPVTILGTCLANTQIGLFRDPAFQSSVTPPEHADNKITVSLTFPEIGRYTICALPPGLKCRPDLGPTILVVAADSCLASDSDRSITKIQTEIALPVPQPPDAASCFPPGSDGQQAVIVMDAQTGYSCMVKDPANPRQCLEDRQKEKKKPYQLGDDDTALLYLVNKNPFRETYRMSLNEQLLADDDIGSFLSLLVPSLGGGSSKPSSTQAATTDTTSPVDMMKKEKTEANGRMAQLSVESQSAQQATDDNGLKDAQDDISDIFDRQADLHQSLLQHRALLSPRPQKEEMDQADNSLRAAREQHAKVEGLLKNLKNKKTDLRARKRELSQAPAAIEAYQKSLEDFAHALAAVPISPAPIQQQSRGVEVCRAVLQDRVDTLVLNYRFFAYAYNQVRNELLATRPRRPEDCTNLLDKAKGLWELTNVENAKVSDSQISLNLRDVGIAIGAPKKDDPSASTDATAVASLTNSVCIWKVLGAKVPPALSSSSGALETVLAKPISLVQTVQIGPYHGGATVDPSLTKTFVKPALPAFSGAEFNAAIDDCISPKTPALSKRSPGNSGSESTTTSSGSHEVGPENGFLRNASFELPMKHVFSAQRPPSKAAQKPASKPSGTKQDTTSDNGGPTGSGTQQAPSGSSGDDSTTTIRGRRINFGSERFIVSIGLAGAPLSQPSFGQAIGQPSFDTSGKPVTGQATTNIVAQTSSSPFRLSPMAFLNSRVWQPAGWVNPVYATFGVTAKSDNSSVRPEYMLGLSQSFLNRHFLMTGGAYVGQQSSLIGGLKVNQAVPSGLTGNLATDNRYRFRLAGAISWRVPGLSKK